MYRLLLISISTILLVGCNTNPSANNIVTNNSLANSSLRQPEAPQKQKHLLRSNIVGTNYYLNGTKVASGKVVNALIDPTKSYQVEAKAPGYVKKEDYIRPPYTQFSELSFTFMIEDKLVNFYKNNGITLSKEKVEYDDAAKIGTVSLAATGAEGRERVVNKVGEICSSKNFANTSGRETSEGGKYMALDERLSGGIYTIRFKCLY